MKRLKVERIVQAIKNLVNDEFVKIKSKSLMSQFDAQWTEFQN